MCDRRSKGGVDAEKGDNISANVENTQQMSAHSVSAPNAIIDDDGAENGKHSCHDEAQGSKMASTFTVLLRDDTNMWSKQVTRIKMRRRSAKKKN